MKKRNEEKKIEQMLKTIRDIMEIVTAIYDIPNEKQTITGEISIEDGIMIFYRMKV